MSICAGIVIAVSFQQVDGTPNAKTCTEGNDQGLQYGDRAVEKCHNGPPSFSAFPAVVLFAAYQGGVFLPLLRSCLPKAFIFISCQHGLLSGMSVLRAIKKPSAVAASYT